MRQCRNSVGRTERHAPVLKIPGVSWNKADCVEPMKTRSPVVVITGASSGIGRCTAGLFARYGWRVGLIARSKVGLEAACDDVEGHGALAAREQVDVTDPDALEAAATAFEQTLGPIDVWVNCAGNASYGRFLDIPAEEFRRVTDVTYLGTVNGTRAALKLMMSRDRGCIINVCSAIAFHGMPLLSSYSGAKHAVRGFNQSIRAELEQDGSSIGLTTLFPPAVNTPFFDHALSHMGRPGRPMPPVYQPEIVAEAIYLAATTHRREMPVSFTAVLFAWGTRFVPGLVERAIRRLGYGGQLSSRRAEANRYEPTLFLPSDQASAVRGGFSEQARSGSIHVFLLSFFARLAKRRYYHNMAEPTARRLPGSIHDSSAETF
jgi:short-subunit dehydrogenase